MRTRLACCLVALPFLLNAQSAPPNPCPLAKAVPPELHIPAKLQPGEPVDFERQLLQYFGSLKYRELNWCVDVGVRDSGPFVNQVNYGTHMAVRIYYSAEVRDWLLKGRVGAIADGAVIIKEQYMPPAQAWADLYDGKPAGSPGDWVFMIKNSKASHDGWFWGEVWNNPTFSPMNFNDPYQYPNAGYGLYCTRCHASAEKESTFSTLSNMQGYAGTNGSRPITYRVDDSWRVPNWQDNYRKYLGIAPTLPMSALRPSLKLESAHNKNMELARLEVIHPGPAPADVPAFLQTFPPEPLDKKVAGPDGHMPPYLTSDQCTGCHSGFPKAAGSAFGPAMVVYPKDTTDASKNVNVSEYGEWRWSPMGLAGRDPIFFSQLQSEFAYAPAQKQAITNICLTCHGAMGLKSYYLDHGIDPNALGANKPINIPGFNADWVYLRDSNDPNFAYGGLARDGISCMVCHRMKPPADTSLDYFLSHTINGNFETDAVGKVNGPFKTADITQIPMKAGLGVEPQGNDFIKTSRMCGNCHTINLPILDKPGCQPGSPNLACTSVEQATYLEWLNSNFQNEYGTGSKAQSCQGCHMSTSYENTASGLKVPVIQTRIATVQDTTYPASDHAAAPADLNVRYREEGYRRHEFLGLNGILLQMFDQFVNQGGNNYILGVRLKDYMSGLATDLNAAIANIVQQATTKTANVTIPKLGVANGKLTAQVKVENLTGHRLPSGVGFRRAFIEFIVYQDGTPIFASGKTNSSGEIVDADGLPLTTEYFLNGRYQPHYYGKDHAVISSPGQVQIYEELTQNAARQFTTSFLQRDAIIKDNRLLPNGYRHDGPPGVKIPEHYLEATRPVEVFDDPAYTSGSGTSTVQYEISVPPGVAPSRFSVRATLQYQSTPPYFFNDRFQTQSPAATRLKYLKSNLELGGTSFQSWKIAISTATSSGR